MKPREQLVISSMNIRAIQAPHNNRLAILPPPESLGFIINDKLLHAADSLDFDTSFPYQVLALPVAAPWLLRIEVIQLAIKLKPKHLIPIHDGMLKDFAARTNTSVLEKILVPHGIQFHPLQPNEVLEV